MLFEYQSYQTFLSFVIAHMLNKNTKLWRVGKFLGNSEASAISSFNVYQSDDTTKFFSYFTFLGLQPMVRVC